MPTENYRHLALSVGFCSVPIAASVATFYPELTAKAKSFIIQNRLNFMAENNPQQQFFNQLAKAQRILIVLPQKINADIAGAGSALALFLKKLEKRVEILAPENFEDLFPFLPKTHSLKLALDAGRTLAVVVDTSQKPLAEISYQQEEHKVKIFLKGQNQTFAPEDVTFDSAREAPYDLAIILGAQSLEDLGPVFEQSADVFYETPKVNIDNSPGNKHFGAINLVEINASSISEITTSLLQGYENDLFDEDIATCLLSGIIANTRSFQHPQVSPSAFLKASHLVAKGARHQEIIRALYKTKPLPLLKLWGRSLARLKDMGEWVFAVLSAQDFAKAEGNLEDLPQVLKELMENLDSKMLWAILGHDGLKMKLVLALRYGLKPEMIFSAFGSGRELKGLISAPVSAWEFNLPESQKLEEAQKQLESVAQKLLPSTAL